MTVNNAGMLGAGVGHHQEIFILSEDNAPGSTGKLNMITVGRATETRFNSGDDIDPATTEAFGNCMGYMLIKMEAHYPFVPGRLGSLEGN